MRDDYFHRVYVELDEQAEIKSIKVEDKEGNTTTIEFLSVRKNFSPSDELFRIKIPPGAKLKKLLEVSIERASKREKLYLQGYEGLEEYAYTHMDYVLSYMNWLFRRDVAGIFVAKHDGKIVGFVAGDGNWFSKREGRVVGAIHELVVSPSYRNKGW